ncbi:MAG TPA: UDP-N-acetylglucosamine--N-acetylmuramyl-(pentapeptide) pyrophosphoryl-undecaprenol N-acetylglucosamine transferase [Gemmatimonadaceae bacterium]|nr:UDP-N-acetylglucosamine--N-acetylmuramyl-(pentapeptide) pyrophosphoryl-undecaprenol N-acetylglucosamine transferase [Gemmatimonadaceae bacterium]
MRVLFTGGGTGGHLYPALAIARALVRLRPDVRPHFVGATRGIERVILPDTEFPHTLLDLHPVYRSAPWRNWRTMAGLVQGWRRLAALEQDAPARLVVATGGYAASGALAFAAAHRIPYVLQEQNSFPGKTVALFARWAREVYLGFPEAAGGLPPAARARAIDTGNPIEPPPAVRPDREMQRTVWGFDASVRFVVLAFGGSQGSAALNGLVDGWIAHGLPPGVGVIWGTGRDHFQRHAARAGRHVVVRPYLAPIAEAYACADLAIARAGAMTTAELCAWGIPMFLVPLPTAAADHQTANARALAEAGAARWIAQREATPAHLAAVVAEVARDAALRERWGMAAAQRGRPDASARIAERLSVLLDATGRSA